MTLIEQFEKALELVEDRFEEAGLSYCEMAPRVKKWAESLKQSEREHAANQ